MLQLGLQENETVMATIDSDEESNAYASAVFDDFKGTGEQFTGVISSLLDKLLNKNFFWILSGENMLPIVNDPTSPWIVCLGNTPRKAATIAPALSMLTAMMLPTMYGHDRNKSFLVVDELPTMILPHLSKIPTTARK